MQQRKGGEGDSGGIGQSMQSQGLVGKEKDYRSYWVKGFHPHITHVYVE